MIDMKKYNWTNCISAIDSWVKSGQEAYMTSFWAHIIEELELL